MDFGTDSNPRQRYRQTHPGNAATNNQHVPNGGHESLPCDRPKVTRFVWSMTNRQCDYRVYTEKKAGLNMSIARNAVPAEVSTVEPFSWWLSSTSAVRPSRGNLRQYSMASRADLRLPYARRLASRGTDNKPRQPDDVGSWLFTSSATSCTTSTCGGLSCRSGHVAETTQMTHRLANRQRARG
jgi:hypothetical protein